MFTTISVLLPTRKRVHILKAMLTSLWNTCHFSDTVEVICRCDHDDMETQEFLRKQKATYIVGPRLKGYGSLPSFMNECACLSKGDLLLMCNDDCVFKTPGWDIKILECANQVPDGIFNIGVSTSLNDNLFPFSIVSRKLLSILGFINDERLLFSDIFLLDLMTEFGRAIRLPTVTIQHDWANPDDDQVRLEASRIENSLVFDGTPGDASDPKRNWRPDYRRLHEKAVKEAVAKIERSGILNILSEKEENVKKVIEAYLRRNSGKRLVNVEEGTQQKTYKLERLYSIDNLAEILKILIYEDDLCRTALVVSFLDWERLALWGSFVKNIVCIRDAPQSYCDEEKIGNCTLVTLPIMDLISLNRFKDFYIGNQRGIFRTIDILVIEDGPYPKVIVNYYIFKRVMTPQKAAVVFVHAGNEDGESGNDKLVDSLRSGVVDNRNHSIHGYITPSTKKGFSIEFM